MHIEFTYARTRAYFRRVLAAGAKRKVQPYLVATGTILAIALLLAVGGEFSAKALLLAIPLAALALVPLALAGRRWRRAVTVPDSRLTPRTWSLTGEAYASRTDDSSTEIVWSDFVSFRATDDAYVLRHRAGATFDIPREPLTAEQDTELATFLRAAQ